MNQVPEISEERLSKILDEYSAGFPELRASVHEPLSAFRSLAVEVPGIVPKRIAKTIPFALDQAAESALFGGVGREIAPERIVALTQGVRPVMAIHDNRVTLEFLGPENAVWAEKIRTASAVLDAAIPAVGRIELTNSELSWAGTGWMIEEGIVVTNRHVIEIFSRMDSSGRFVFRRGFSAGEITSDIDFLEEEDRADRNEHPVGSILWASDEYDVAFLSVSRASGGPALPTPIRLSERIEVDSLIAAIGYPARDPTIPDQELVRRVFGDVYEKKRLSPGKVMSMGEVLRHDCSTLGGNSGSALIDLETGEAVGLHFGGYLDDSANVAVPAPRLRILLEEAKRARERMPGASAITRETMASGLDQTLRFEIRVPIELDIRLGVPVFTMSGAGSIAAASIPAVSLDAAVQTAQATLLGRPEVIGIHAGYRFKGGWITDEPAVVVTVSSKMSPSDLELARVEPLPREILGFGIDVRTASVADQLATIGVPLVIERPARPAGYIEPPGFDDPKSDMVLNRVRDRMHAIFHVSPDSAFPNLKKFLGRVRSNLTATMYEWDADHISDAIEAAMQPRGNRLRMVTQRRGVGGRDGTEIAVKDMARRIGAKFEHAWAPVIGPMRLFAGFYHIKVASRDDEEFWLSSGNWKDSNQADIDPAGDNSTSPTPLDEHNREWHAIIAHRGLASLFRRYIDYDFREARRVGEVGAEIVNLPDIELFVEMLPKVAAEAPRRIRYFDPLELDEELDIEPLLTPDRNARGQRMFMAAVNAMIARATRSIYVQNQSFSYSGADNDEVTRFLTTLRDKQRAGLDVRIIFRDARDYPDPGGVEDQTKLIERLKKFGFDVSPDGLKLQSKCHTKGIIIDSEEVILGSQNLTNGGALFNRDASLLVRSATVARYFEEIFRHDWENLAHNNADERIRGIRLAAAGEAAPPGFKRVSLSDLLSN
jgi:phosphatidylserine/phosphatidylglycerophosphate/cardiolipin synthase-like enzyme/S1-C subfamily serine protease